MNATALTDDLETNIQLIRAIFHADPSLIARRFENQIDPNMKCCVIYIDGMVNNQLMNDNILKPVMEYQHKVREKTPDYIDIIQKKIVLSNSVERTDDPEKISQALVYGDSLLLAEGGGEGLILNTKGWITRTPAEPDNDRVLRGPREGFNESLIINLSMMRRRLRTQDLRMEFKQFGARSNTRACICYLDHLVNRDILKELENRLKKIEIDGVIDSNYITELIKDAPFSMFKTIGSTEKPDVVAAKLLEGRIALLLDGTPVVLTLPYLFIENFQSSDDYYINFHYSSVSRMLRILSFLVSISAPAIYVGLTTFHHEMLPAVLLQSISLARQGVPLPSVVEAMGMMIVFELLRESGLRTPQGIGHALSIVGALVIGQAAVEARLISAPMIIIVAVSGITGIMLPKIKGGVIILRFALLIITAIIGLFGYVLGMISLLLYLLNMRSFGLPVIGSMHTVQESKDIFVRASWKHMLKRPMFMSSDPVRKKPDGDSK